MKKILLLVTSLVAGFAVYDNEELIDTITGSDAISSIFEALTGGIVPTIWSLCKAFVANPFKSISVIGHEFVDTLGLDNVLFFSADFIFRFVGLIILIKLLWFILSTAVELFCKFVDVT